MSTFCTREKFIQSIVYSSSVSDVNGWERLVFDDIVSILQQNRFWWYGHVLCKEDNDWVKKCMEYEVEGARPTDRPRKTWREIVEKDCKACKLNREDAMDRYRWKKHIRDDWWVMTMIGVSGWMFLLVLVHSGCPGHSPESHKMVVCVCDCVCVSVMFS